MSGHGHRFLLETIKCQGQVNDVNEAWKAPNVDIRSEKLSVSFRKRGDSSQIYTSSKKDLPRESVASTYTAARVTKLEDEKNAAKNSSLTSSPSQVRAPESSVVESGSAKRAADSAFVEANSTRRIPQPEVMPFAPMHVKDDEEYQRMYEGLYVDYVSIGYGIYVLLG